MAVITGHGTTISWGTTTGWTPTCISITGPGATREVLDTTHLGTTGARSKKPGDLPDWQPVTVDYFYEPEDGYPPIAAVAETITLTNPDAGAATEVFSGFVSGFEGAEHVTDQLMRCTLTIQPAGAVTHTP